MQHILFSEKLEETEYSFSSDMPSQNIYFLRSRSLHLSCEVACCAGDLYQRCAGDHAKYVIIHHKCIFGLIESMSIDKTLFLLIV